MNNLSHIIVLMDIFECIIDINYTRVPQAGQNFDP